MKALAKNSLARDSTFGDETYVDVLFIKPLVIRYLSTLGLHVIYSDSDVVYIRSPLTLFYTQRQTQGF